MSKSSPRDNSPEPNRAPSFKEIHQKRLLTASKAFNDKYPTEQHCTEMVFQSLKSADRIRCHHCSSHKIEHQFGERKLRCLECRKVTFFTKETFFDHAHSMRGHLSAIWLLEQGIAFNAAELARMAAIATSSAWGILLRLSKVLEARASDKKETVSASLFVATICRRSRESPARQHPAAEFDGLAQSTPPNQALRPVTTDSAEQADALSLSETEQFVFDHLENHPAFLESIVEATELPEDDVFSALSMLNLAGLIKITPGPQYARIVKNRILSTTMALASPALQTALRDLKTFLKEIFGGVSFKYLQSYLLRYSCLLEPTGWKNDGLLQECANAPNISLLFLTQHPSPHYVDMWLPA